MLLQGVSVNIKSVLQACGRVLNVFGHGEKGLRLEGEGCRTYGARVWGVMFSALGLG